MTVASVKSRQRRRPSGGEFARVVHDAVLIPLPVSATDVVADAALLRMSRVADSGPVCVGENVTDTVQDPFGVRLLQLLVATNAAAPAPAI